MIGFIYIHFFKLIYKCMYFFLFIFCNSSNVLISYNYIALYKHQEEHHFILKYLIIEKLFFHYFVSLWHLNCSFIFKCTFISPIHAIKKHDNVLCKCTSFFVIFFYRFLSLSMPNYISVIFLANVFAGMRILWLKRNVLCRTLISQPARGLEGDLSIVLCSWRDFI